jgi:glutathione S-transferase
MFIYHIAAAADWARAQRDGQYTMSTRGRTLADEGFIHASAAAQVTLVANTFYQGEPDLLLLVIDPARVDSEIRYEHVPGQALPYPHIYGPLNLAAVVQARPFPPDPNGQFSFNADPPNEPG